LKLSQVLQIAVQVTRDWVSDRPHWGGFEWSLCLVWAGRVPEATEVCRGQLEQLRLLAEQGELAPNHSWKLAGALVAEALATDLVVRLWLCCWARQALELYCEGEGMQPLGLRRGVLPERLPAILNRLMILRQAVIDILLALPPMNDGLSHSGASRDLNPERLRRVVEWWTDRLTGALVVGWGHPEFCLHPTRALAWGAERRLWTGSEGPVTPWEWDLLEVRALGPCCGLPAGPGDVLRRGVLSLLSGRSRELPRRGAARKKPGTK
jgi:hypothetical protein